jgi:hypothetical protein
MLSTWQPQNLGGWEASRGREERSPTEKATGLARKAITAPNSANAAAVDATTRGLRCQFFCSLGCMEEHAAESCSIFTDLGPEDKEKAFVDCRLCTFRLRHPEDTECFSKGSVSKPTCKVPECKGQHAESLHEMMTRVVLTINAVGCEEEEGEKGYVNQAKGEHSYENNNGWRTPDDS